LPVFLVKGAAVGEEASADEDVADEALDLGIEGL
jgi:hypothetical protein